MRSTCGAVGPRGYGVNCSGRVLQALYSAGLDPQPITVDKHVLPDYWTSRELLDHPLLAHLLPFAIRRGDLVFWRSTSTTPGQRTGIPRLRWH